MLSSTLLSTLSSTLPIALNDTLPACLTIRSQVSSQDAPNHTPEHALKYTPNCTQLYTPSLLDYTLPIKLSRHSQEHLRVARKYTLQREDTPNLAWWYAPMYTPGCSIERLVELQKPGTGRREAGGVWWSVFGGQRIVAEIMMWVNILVWIMSLACPPWQDLTMSHGHGVDNCSLRFRRNCRQFELGKSRYRTQIFLRNLLPAYYRLYAYVCTFCLGLMEMMAMAMTMAIAMAIVMVLVIVIIVPEVLRQVDWQCQSQHQSFHRIRAFY